MEKLYDDKQYFEMANEANVEGKKLIKVQEEIEYEVTVLEWEKKIIKIPIYNDKGEIIGYEEKEVDDYTKPIIDPETGEQAYHIETRTKWVEKLEIVDNPENFERNFFNTSLGYVRRKPYVKGTGEYKDFLSDMLAGMEIGQQIITYTADMKQNIVTVTQEFLNECVAQFNRDFYGN